jgi:uncharacterized membrane protein YdbT with pleckstrin-like domain
LTGIAYAAQVAFPRKDLNVDEEVVLDLRPHWIYLAPATLLLVVAIVVGVVVAVWSPESDGLDTASSIVALVLLAVAVVFFGVKYAKWVTTMFVLTTDRLVTRWGVLAKSGTEIPLERINTVFFNQSLFERVLGAGDLTIESAGEQGSGNFTDIRKPAVVQREIYVQMERNENRKFDRVRGPGGGLSTAEQLEKLHQLLQQGALTQVQFEAERARLLGT